MNAALKYLSVVRFPHETDCTWAGPGKCCSLACRHSILGSRPHLDRWEPEDVEALVEALPETCALALADYGGLTTDQVAVFLGIPRDAVERTEASALRRLRMNRELRRLCWDERP